MRLIQHSSSNREEHCQHLQLSWLMQRNEFRASILVSRLSQWGVRRPDRRDHTPSDLPHRLGTLKAVLPTIADVAQREQPQECDRTGAIGCAGAVPGSYEKLRTV